MAVHQAAMRHTVRHEPGVDTHSMCTFIEIARSLMQMGRNQGGQGPTEGKQKYSSACLHVLR